MFNSAPGAETELSRSAETLGVSFSQADLATLAGAGKDPTAAFDRLTAIEAVAVTSHEAGKAGGKPYTIDFTAAPNRCQTINPDGSYTDANS